MKDKTPTIIAASALVVAVLAAPPVGQAAGKFVLGKNSVGAAQLISPSVREPHGRLFSAARLRRD